MNQAFPDENYTATNIIIITIFKLLTDKLLNVRTAQIVKNYCQKEISRYVLKEDNETQRTILKPMKYVRKNKSKTIIITNIENQKETDDIIEEYQLYDQQEEDI